MFDALQLFRQTGGGGDSRQLKLPDSTVLDIEGIGDGEFLKRDGSTVVGAAGTGGGDTLPVVDSTALVKDPSDATKQVRIDAGSVGTGQTRVITMPNADVNLGNIAVSTVDLDGAADIGAALADGDLLLVDDGAGGTNRKSAVSRFWTYIWGKVTGSPGKTTPVDADSFPIVDSAASNATKLLTWANLKATLLSSLKLDDFAAPDDNTDLNASTSKHGLLPKLSGTSTEFLNGVGAWATPAGGGGGGAGYTDHFFQGGTGKPCDTADHPVSTAAYGADDAVAPAKSIWVFKEAAESGRLLGTIRPPTGVSNIILETTFRAQTAPSGDHYAVLKYYFRAANSGGAWSSYTPTKLTLTDSETTWQAEDSQTVAIGTFGLTAGTAYDFAVTRAPADGNDDLVDELYVAQLNVRWA